MSAPPDRPPLRRPRAALTVLAAGLSAAALLLAFEAPPLAAALAVLAGGAGAAGIAVGAPGRPGP